ncbi:MAG: DNA-binding protein WhiA [Parasporobacterium sp.]|nr:DNA-binding protein WhiA [Parasporobacterium sp.]
MRSEDTVISWTVRVRDELVNMFTRSEKCRKAELTAILIFNSQCVRLDRETGRYIYEEPVVSGKNSLSHMRKTYNIKEGIDLKKDPKDIYKDTESRRAFLRGAFMATGLLTDPAKSYHLEIIANQLWQAEELQILLEEFEIYARITERRDKYVLYLRDGDAIVDMLNIIGAHQTLMDFENVRILKEHNESVNRRVNCDMANISKAVAASGRQLRDIELIRDTAGLDSLDENLRHICEIRLQYPEAALSELGDLMVPPLGKSGVNHRFRKLSQIADKIRLQQEKEL